MPRDKEVKIPDYCCGYPVLGLAGRGMYATVYIIAHTKGKRALRVPKDENLDMGIDSVLEIDILTRMRHPNLMCAESIINDDSYRGIATVLPYCRTNLHKAILEEKLSVSERVEIGFKIICAANYLLSCGILHLDIKPNNIMLHTEENIPLLSDFGMAVRMDDPKVSIPIYGETISYEFRPYELLKNSGYPYLVGEHTLVWEMGILLIFMFGERYLKGEKPPIIAATIELYLINTKKDPRIMQNTLDDYFRRVVRDTNIRNELVDLVSKMLDTRIEYRISLYDVIKHPFWHNTCKNFYPEYIRGGSITPTISSHTISWIAIKRIINHWWEITLDFYSDLPAGLLFVTADLMYRTPYLANGTDSSKMLHSLACCCIAWKMYCFRGKHRSPSYSIKSTKAIPWRKETNLRTEDILDMEIKIIIELKGRLYHHYVFDSTRKDDLADIVWKVLLDPKLYTNYRKHSSYHGEKQSLYSLLKEVKKEYLRDLVD